MIIHVKQSFEIVSPSGETFKARNGDIVIPPDWVAHNSFFKMLCDSGRVTAHIDSKSVELEQAKEEKEEVEKKENFKKGKK